MLYHLNAVAVAASLCLLAAADQCYFPDGTASTDVPCNSTATNSACCSSSAYCLSNGVCMDSGILSRGSCTDQTWSADECSPYCQSENTGGGFALMPCSNMTFTCGLDPSTCSDASSVFIMHDAESVVLRPNQLASAMDQAGLSNETTSSNTNTGSASDQAHTVTATSSAVQNNEKAYTGADMAGVGIGVAVPLLLAVGALSWLLVRERKRINRSGHVAFAPLQSPDAQGHADSWKSWDKPAYGEQREMPSELSGEQVSEIGTPHRLAEL